MSQSPAASASSKLHSLLSPDGRPEEDKESNLGERRKIRAAFELFDRDRKRTVPKEEVGTIMRYLGAYPSEEELITVILPSLSDDEETTVVKLDQFESFMLRVLLDRQYEPDSEEMILQAFKVLDPENRGYIDEHTMHELLTENEYAFRDKEWEDFCRISKDPDTNYIHYEDYVSMLSS